MVAHASTQDSVCTICGGPRSLSEPGFSAHQRSEQHQLAVRAFDIRHARTYSLEHHRGHIALGIGCRCLRRTTQAAAERSVTPLHPWVDGPSAPACVGADA